MKRLTFVNVIKTGNDEKKKKNATKIKKHNG